MGTSQTTVDWILDQLISLESIRARKMFGEYAIYFRDTVVALICDNRLFVKQTDAGLRLIDNARLLPPYEGAKSHLVIDESKIADQRWLCELVQATYAELSTSPKKKTVPKKKTGAAKEPPTKPKKKEASSLLNSLQSEIDRLADEKTRTWFTNYLKGVISYRGVKTPKLNDIVQSWIKQQGIGDLEFAQQLDLAFSLLAQKHAEDKLCGALFIQKHLLKKASPTEILDRMQTAFESSHIWDWSTNDWYCVRVLGPLLVNGDKKTLNKVAAWRNAENLWQRRSSIVAFRATVKMDRDHDLTAKIVSTLVKDPERFIQTGIGWFLSDKSKYFPDLAESLVEKHFARLSTEVIDRHTKFLPMHKQYKARKRSSAASG